MLVLEINTSAASSSPTQPQANPASTPRTEPEHSLRAELDVGLRELALDRVRSQLLEQREQLIDNATLVALHAMQTDHLASLSESESLTQPATG